MNKILPIEEIQKKKALDRYKKLHKEREKILLLSPEKALDRILSDHEPSALVHAFPEEDLYLLVHDLGPEDSIQLLSLASEKQLEFILDIESWEKDRIELNSMTKWLNLFLNADPVRLIEWFLKEKTEFIEFYLFKNIEVLVRENDQDPSDFGEGYFTFDDTFYIRLIDNPYGQPLEENEKKSRGEFLYQFLEHLASYDHVTFQNVLFEAMTVIPAESEEEAYRLRNQRLAEKGFLPFEEAVGIYKYLNPQELEQHPSKTYRVNSEIDLYPAPYYFVNMLKEGGLFTSALKVVEGYEILQRIQLEFATLCNQIIAADRKKIRGKNELHDVVKKACGYISMGLERLIPPQQGSCSKRVKASAMLILRHPLSQLFRTGFGLGLELKWRADKWRQECWFEKAGLPLTFWCEEWLGVLGGLLIKKPLFFDNYKTGVLYREFVSLDDIKVTEKILNDIIAFDDLLSLMGLETRAVLSSNLVNYKNLMLTLWSKNYLGLPADPVSVNLVEFKKIFKELWVDDTQPRKIRVAIKESFLGWISGLTGLRFHEINQNLGEVFEDLFSEIESEYGTVSSEDIDPRYINLFLINKQKT